jgi:hypothetical protein
MPNAHPRPYRAGSIFGEGIRHPLDRERRSQWKARLAMHERAGRITSDHEKIGLAMLRRLGQDGRLDPSHTTIANDCGKAASTVQRALKRLAACGLLGWLRRIVRDGNRVVQTSNAYLLTLGNPPSFPENRCEARTDRQTRKDRDSSVHQTVLDVSDGDRAEARTALASRQAAVLAAMAQKRLTRGAVARS